MQRSTLLLAFATLTLTWAPLISAQEESSTVAVSSSSTSAAATAAATAASSTVRPESLTSPATSPSSTSSSPASSGTTTTTVAATSTTGAPEGNAKAAQATPTPAASLASSLLSGLFDTITTTKTSKDCPGKCVHVFAALLCEKVLDNVTCSEPSMRCCVENRPPPTRSVPTTKAPATTAASPTPAKTSASTAQVKNTEATTTQTSTTTMKSTTKAITTKASTAAASTTAATTQKPTTTTKATTTSTASTPTTVTTTKPPTTTTATTKAPTTTQKPATAPKTAAPTTTATTRSPATATTDSKEAKADETTEASDDDDVLKASAIPSLKVCPGVCVATRISDFCEAVLNVEGLCKTGMRCCVTKSLFGEAEPPPELVILNEASAVPPSSTEGSTSSTTTTKATTTTRPSTTVTTTRPKPKSTTASPNNDKRCKGTCVTGFFSYLCDYIDTKAVCSNGGKCCISRRETGSGASSGGETRNGTSTSARPSSTVRPSSTTPRPAAPASTKAAATTTAKPSTTTPAPLKRCPGVCLPGLMSAFCSKPSVIINNPPNLCERGSVCCDSKNRESPESEDSSTSRPGRPTTRPPSNPVSDLLSNPLTSLLAGPLISSLANAALQRPAPGPEKADVSPSRPQATTSRPASNRPASNRPASRPTSQAPTTTTTTTTTTPAPQVVDTRPYCPGTCMAPILSFSCFGNAEITDLFRCPSSKVVCCAQKSAIRELRPALPPGVQEIPQTELNKPETGFRPPPMVRPPPVSGSAVAAPPSLQLPPPAATSPDAGRRPSVPRPAPHSKFVCGVKGTHREIRAASSNSTGGYRRGRSADSTTTISGYRRGRVVGGSDALPGEYCWQVALINSLNQYLCGGALIGTQWVLTAAHCVTNIVRSGDAIYVRVGDHDLTSRYGSPGAQTLRVATTYIHHNHNSQTLDNDIALLKLQGQAELKPGVCIICLPSRGAIPETGRRCTVTGYGYMGESGPIPLRVREAEVPIVSEGECVRQINAVTEKIFIMPASSFCAGGEAGNDACQGDGGGPLVCEDDGYFELTGLVSWGFGCGRSQVPGVYVKVSSFISWINQIISVNNV